MVNSAFGFEKPEHSPGFLLWQTMVMWQRRIKQALDPHNITHAQFVILANTLWFSSINKTPTQILIARSTKLDKMTVSKSLRKLAAQNLIKRVEHKEDTRAKSISLTTKGKAMVSELVPIVEKIDADFFGVVSETKQQSLINILANLISKIEKQE